MDSNSVRDINSELKAVGVKTMGLIAPESKLLSKLLNDNEKIMGVVYGKYTGGLAWLVATNLRVIFIDRKLFFSSTDEISYDVVSGVKLNRAGAFSSVILHTRMGDYNITYVSPEAADIFVKYIENQRIEDRKDKPNIKEKLPILNDNEISKEASKFLNTHDLAVLSTIDRTGNVHGAVVNYAIDQDNFIYILTKTGTNKGRNINSHTQVALTVFEQGSLETVQLRGSVEVENKKQIQEKVYKKITQPRNYKSGVQLPPSTMLYEGEFIIMKITPETVNYYNYSKN